MTEFIVCRVEVRLERNPDRAVRTWVPVGRAEAADGEEAIRALTAEVGSGPVVAVAADQVVAREVNESMRRTVAQTDAPIVDDYVEPPPVAPGA